MFRNILGKFLLLIISISLCGCFAMLAGAGGTAIWQAGKVISEENVSMSRAVSAAESVFDAEKIILTEKVAKNEVTQLRGRNLDEKKVSVDIFVKGLENVRIEIRIGLGEEAPARELLTKIKKRL